MGLNTQDLLSQLVKEVLHNSCNVSLPYICMYHPKPDGLFMYITTHTYT